jgi:hypothetical protein
MARGLAAQSVIAQTSLLAQILPTVLSGILAFAAAVYLAVRNSEAEHQRWLRQERHKAYTAFLAAANDGLVDLKILRIRLASNLENVGGAIEDRAQQTSYDLQRLFGSIKLLGPQDIVTVASNVVLQLDWKQVDMNAGSESLERTDPSRRYEKIADPPADLDLFTRLLAAEAALEEFERLAIQRIGRRWTGRRDERR